MKMPPADEAPICPDCNRQSVWDFFWNTWYCFVCIKIVDNEHGFMDKEDDKEGD